ncbi:tetratricopeptide repeat protein [Pokkaliibacter sp. CJK22405]|uniref:tetratricopeptide repeat protein n=1 Tax=Pokkaliibacter sp. CJK22405 TaxID=3384615 RepID=UPI0039850DD2
MAMASRLRHEYYLGLQHLLSDRNDEAMESFERALELDSDAIDIHLAVADLFRRKGDVARAVRVHLNLLERGDLSSRQRQHVRIGLARDYLSSGLLDRAEDILLQFLNRPETTNRLEVLSLLADIYEQERDWEKAIDVMSRYLALQDDSGTRARIAHYHCEIAELALQQKHPSDAQRSWEDALNMKRGMHRALLARCRWALQQSHWRIALRDIKSFRRYNKERLVEGLSLLLEVYTAIGHRGKLIKLLEDWYQASQASSILIARARLMESLDRPVDDFFLAQLKSRPTLKAASYLLARVGPGAGGVVADTLTITRRTLDDLTQARPVYLCANCGFRTRQLHWQCPKCRTWDSVKPITGLEGE